MARRSRLPTFPTTTAAVVARRKTSRATRWTSAGVTASTRRQRASKPSGEERSSPAPYQPARSAGLSS